MLQPYVETLDPFVVADFDGNARPTAHRLDLVKETVELFGAEAFLRASAAIVRDYLFHVEALAIGGKEPIVHEVLNVPILRAAGLFIRRSLLPDRRAGCAGLGSWHQDTRFTQGFARHNLGVQVQNPWANIGLETLSPQCAHQCAGRELHSARSPCSALAERH